MALIEEKNPWIAPTSLNILRIRKSKKYRLYYSYFYVWINAILLSIVGLTTGYYFKDNAITVLAAISVVIIGFSISTYYMMKKSGEWDEVAIHGFR